MPDVSLGHQFIQPLGHQFIPALTVALSAAIVRVLACARGRAIAPPAVTIAAISSGVAERCAYARILYYPSRSECIEV